ncbi:MAG: DsrE family protein [Candidatus Electryonea clarkiae]|nr:DsrE family protein [Candidatus Electryonea clarkiae]
MPEEEKTEKIVIFATHGVEDPERASLPFVMGNAALALDINATVVLQGVGVVLATKSCYGHVFAAGLPPLKELVDTFVELGGRILVCGPCIKERKITPDLLVDMAEVSAAGKVVMAAIEADAVLNY